MVTITRLETADDAAVRALNALLPEMTATAWPMTQERLALILQSASQIFVARDGERVVGVAQFVMVHQLKDTKAWVEDIVVTADYRGQGIAKQLLHTVIEAARAAGVRSLNMTSRPGRTAAHGLYEKLGFKRRETAVYRLPLLDDHI
jgi:GNAT superfamily N-acetyltransferase